MEYITINKNNIVSEHICCAISDKKYRDSYELKIQWLKGEFDNDYVFRSLDERAKVFMEYGPAENEWIPVQAPDYMMIGCFWVSGKYKGNGHGKALLKQVIDDAQEQAREKSTAMKELMESALIFYLDNQNRNKKQFRFKNHSFKGNGVCDGVEEGAWDPSLR